MKNKIEDILDNNSHLQKLLFRRGYLFTSKKMENINVFPFYNHWSESKIKNYYLYLHNDQKKFMVTRNNKTFVLIGHAYNPWDNISNESQILEVCADALEVGKINFFSELSKISGVFIIIVLEKNKIFVVQDSTGIMPLFYSENNKDIYYSSHSQLIADICDFNMDHEIDKLLNSKFYLIGIRHLPGIKSPFNQIKALTANTYLESHPFTVQRFFPSRQFQEPSENPLEMICNVLKNSMMLVSEKFNASISLTGGTDSKMTLAAAKDYYGKFNYFSFFSTEAEEKDAKAAHKICEQLGLNHTIYMVPKENDDIDNFEIISQIINHNAGYIKKHKSAELRKIIFLYQQNEIEMEVKSHISEIGRAFYYKKLGKKLMPSPLTPRHMSNLYKRNMFNRATLKYMDDAFQEFIDVTNFGEGFNDRYDESDMFYWEHRMSQWASLVKQDFDISNNTTIIYNNRKLLDLFMDFKLEDRIEDNPQKEIIKSLNESLFELNISNENAMKNKKRILLEKLFFEVNSRLLK
ncbi:asparagine synthase-related protein [Bacillus sp. UNC438CL73TsuS30]|uniref:asparagine synthase-related protein n=1 Tax=Bacillus sp. UNC438CL73TsuS30 TaxID=1340434 RepID=UPI00047E4400|nr:asparagine synthase-related protein [Bacillus sp. UNC438CL73TsuS30]